jgi:hypothetical protein
MIHDFLMAVKAVRTAMETVHYLQLLSAAVSWGEQMKGVCVIKSWQNFEFTELNWRLLN